ncbi:dihydropteroate synthase [Cryomorphaceae bacterium]|nr:dihydropteroate synthase [Cryomorphaceae bacterium]
MTSSKGTLFGQLPSIRIGGQLLDFSTPKVMGIVNLTPDSFVSESRATQLDDVRRKVDQHLDAGAHILDFGAYSSRPGAQDISVEEEWSRIEGILLALRADGIDTPISIDTFRAEVARRALEEGADIINDISGGSDPDMFPLVAQSRAPYILMHMQGTPQNMQDNPTYGDVVRDVNLYLAQKIRTLRELGVHDIIADVGFGFGKTVDQNYALLRELRQFHALGVPLLVGVSRKSMINKVLDIKAAQALNGTSVLHAFALERGAAILRAHDVREAVEAVKLFQALRAD